MTNLTKQRLLNKIELTETMINIYSDRDRNRVHELEIELWDLNQQLLDIMTNEAA